MVWRKHVLISAYFVLVIMIYLTIYNNSRILGIEIAKAWAEGTLARLFGASTRSVQFAIFCVIFSIQFLLVIAFSISNNQQLITDSTHDKNTDENPCGIARERSPWIRRRRMPDGKIGEIRCLCFSLPKGAPNWSSKSAIYGKYNGRTVFLSCGCCMLLVNSCLLGC